MSGRFGSGAVGLHGALRSEAPIASSGVPWIDRKVREIAGAREFLDQLGYNPRPHNDESRDYYRRASGWRLRGYVGMFGDDQLIEFAKELGFRP